MKRSTLIAIIVGLVTFIGAVAATLYYLKKRGIIFVDDEYECKFEEVEGNVLGKIEDTVSDVAKKAVSAVKGKEKQVESLVKELEAKAETATEEASGHFGF